MSSRSRVLQEIIASALRACPHVDMVEPFGSLPAGSGDDYSDVDLRVHANCIPEAIASRHECLSAAGPAEVELIVNLRPGSFCTTVLFGGESCYHGVDLEFCPAGNVSQDELLKAALSCSRRDGLYLPKPGEPGHFLVGQLLGGVRYAKASKRGQHLTCWRFLSATLDWLCALLHEQRHGWQESSRKLKTEEYQALDDHP